MGKLYKEIELLPKDNIESIVYQLLAANARGEYAYCNLNGVELRSDTITMDLAYQKVFNCTQKEYIEKYGRIINFEKTKSIKEKVAESRKEGIKPITTEIIVRGLKFIAENPNISQDDLVDGLLEIGCNYQFDDLKGNITDSITNGLKVGNIYCGAAIISYMRDDVGERMLIKDRLLNQDSDISIYNFIRVVTGDKGYTKEYVDGLHRQKRM